MSTPVKLTEFSHGAGCGCKISPAVLEKIIGQSRPVTPFPELLVGNSTKDDAAAYDLGNGDVILSTTDFFMPIADDPFDFGRIAATNAISDIYAMGGTPLMAIAILGWPVNVLEPDIAAQVIDGGRTACNDAGMPLAGGHSIDSPEPIFGLAVTGRVAKQHLRTNDAALAGCELYLTKPLGIGVLTTAQKQKKLMSEHVHLARDLMCTLNNVGRELALIPQVTALTDVTGFGLLGHLLEMSEGSNLQAHLEFDAVPLLAPVKEYLSQGCIPGGTQRNFESYGSKVSALSELQKNILCDPQTSGGLLVAVLPEARDQVCTLLQKHHCESTCIGTLATYTEGSRVLVK